MDFEAVVKCIESFKQNVQEHFSSLDKRLQMLEEKTTTLQSSVSEILVKLSVEEVEGDSEIKNSTISDSIESIGLPIRNATDLFEFDANLSSMEYKKEVVSVFASISVQQFSELNEIFIIGRCFEKHQWCHW